MATRSIRRRGIGKIASIAAVVGLVFVLAKTLRNLPSVHAKASTAAKLAFFIQVSTSTVLHIPRLLQALHHPENLYAIHFDSHISTEQTAFIKSLLRGNSRLNNVIVMPSEPVSYAGVTMLLNTLNAIETLLHVSSDWDFFINLSGADYPLVSPVALRKLLALTPVRGARLNMLQRQESDRDMAWFFKRRLGTIHIDPALFPSLLLNDTEILDLKTAHPLSKMNHKEVPFVKSEGWVILHRSFAKYAVHSAQGRRLLLSYTTARAPDELFFGSLISSSEFRSTVAWDAMRFILWGLPGVRWSRPAFLDDVDTDIRDSLVSSGALFARKFLRPESDLLDFIDANVSGVHGDSDENGVEEFYQRTRTRLLCIAETRTIEGCG